MITEEMLASIAFIKKEDVTGSYEGMRFKLYPKKVGEETKLGAVIWPEPFNCLKTPEEEKLYEEFDFNEDGLSDAERWLNNQWSNGRERWIKAKKWNMDLF